MNPLKPSILKMSYVRKKKFKKEIKSSPYNAIAIRKQIDLMIGVKKKGIGEEDISQLCLHFICLLSCEESVTRRKTEKCYTYPL